MSQLDYYFDQTHVSPKDLVLSGIKQIVNTNFYMFLHLVKSKPVAILYTIGVLGAASIIVYNATVQQTERHPNPLFTLDPTDTRQQTQTNYNVNKQERTSKDTSSKYLVPLPKARFNGDTQNATTTTSPSQRDILTPEQQKPSIVPPTNQPLKPKSFINSKFAEYQTLKRPIDFSTPQGQSLVRDVQTALSERGFYKGKISGKWGEHSVAALRAYEILNGLPDSGMPSPELLAALNDNETGLTTSSLPHKIDEAQIDLNQKQKMNQFLPKHLQPENITIERYEIPETPIQQMDKQAPEHTNPWGTSLTMAVEQRLFALGLNPGKVDGKYTMATQVAIEKFERMHAMPITGRVSGRLLQEMSALSNSPIM